jgi:hypothetical protein
LKKSILVLAAVFVLSLFASCAFPVKKTEAAQSAGSAAPSASAQETAPAASAAVSAEGTAAPAVSPSAEAETPAPAEQSPAASSEKPAGGGLTLEKIKQAVISAGYEVGTVGDAQIPSDPSPAGSFDMIYKDETTEAQAPVFEFKTAQDALAYAKKVNESGYSLCIVNGKFLAITGASYGIALNDKEVEVLETLLQGKLTEYTPPILAPLVPAKDYSGACAEINILYKALDALVNKSVLLHDKKADPDKSIQNAFVTFSLISSGDLSFTAQLGESQAQLDYVKQVWEMFGVTDMKVKHDKPNDYVMTGKRAGLDTSFEIHCSFDPATGSLRLKDTDGGKVIEFYEFVPLGGDRYAFQSLYERAIVTYKGTGISAFIYSLKERAEENAYNTEKDSIYGKTAAAGDAWVTPAAKDTYDQFITYDGTTLRIAANSFVGDRLNVDISVG